MKHRRIIFLVTVIIALTTHVLAQDDDDDDKMQVPRVPVMKPTDKPAGPPFACPYETNFQRPHKVGTYTLRLLPLPKPKDAVDSNGDPRCRAVLTAPSGKKTIIAEDWALTLDPMSGADFNGDGKPELILESYSGGVHCCYRYQIVTVERTPRVLHSFQNQVPVNFEKQADGSLLIRGADGVFDFFLLPHNAAVIPRVALKLEGNKLVDVSSQFQQDYDKEIEQARNRLTEADIAKVRTANFHDKMFVDVVPALRNVLTIVLDYLYSGREEKAWQTLKDYWPEEDQRRAKSLILERRNRGLLADLECECRPALVARRPNPQRKPPKDEPFDPRIRDITED